MKDKKDHHKLTEEALASFKTLEDLQTRMSPLSEKITKSSSSFIS